MTKQPTEKITVRLEQRHMQKLRGNFPSSKNDRERISILLDAFYNDRFICLSEVETLVLQKYYGELYKEIKMDFILDSINNNLKSLNRMNEKLNGNTLYVTDTFSGYEQYAPF